MSPGQDIVLSIIGTLLSWPRTFMQGRDNCQNFLKSLSGRLFLLCLVPSFCLRLLHCNASGEISII